MNFTHYIDEPEDFKPTLEMFDPLIPIGGKVFPEIKEVTQRLIKLRSLLTEEMILQFMITGKNEYHIVERKLEDKVIISLEKKSEQ